MRERERERATGKYVPGWPDRDLLPSLSVVFWKEKSGNQMYSNSPSLKRGSILLVDGMKKSVCKAKIVFNQR